MKTLDVKVGDKIKFVEEKQAYTVRARNERFIICVKPFNARKTVLYTIIDLERDVRGACNLIFGHAMEDENDIQSAMQKLQNHCDGKHEGISDGCGVVPPFKYQASMEVSYRNFIDLKVEKINGVAQ